MKRLPFLILLVAATVGFFAFKIFNNEEKGKYELIMERVANLLSQGHYNPQTINDDFSQKIFNEYLEALDGKKNIFLQKDVDSLGALYAKKIDDELNGAKVESFIGISKVFDKRVAEASKWKDPILSKPFNYTIKESIDVDPKKIKYPATQKEREDRWRKMIKLNALELYVELQEDKSKEKLSDKELEKLAREKTEVIIGRLFDSYKTKSAGDYRFNMFVNVITTTMDPHTEFFPPADKKYFDEQLSGVFFGIGAQLQYTEGMVKVSNLNVGSPAAKSGQIAPGDIIAKVAQGKDAEYVDLLGFDMDDAVKLIRGKEGSEVKLAIKKPDGTVKDVVLIRAKIENEETFAKSAIIIDSVNHTKVGIIHLPEFYTSFGDKEGRSSFTDVAREVQKLKDEKVDGIIMDLRMNGGGSLQDVVQMVGLFIKDGPIVQVKDRVSNAVPLNDDDESVLYTGPLAVMVNEFSASASEIFAAAIQDYKRGIIIGSTSTYGKGTVQQNIGLDHTGFKRDGNGDLGAVKLTLRKFYRVSGGSTQLKGVESDIVLPSQLATLEMLEKDNEFALKYDEIPKSTYTPWSSEFDINTLKQLSNTRLLQDSSFQIIKRNSAWIAAESDKSRSLNINQYKEEKKLIKAKADQIDAAQKLKNGLKISLLPTEMDKYQGDTVRQARLKDWIKNLSQDIYLNQADLVIDDMIGKSKTITQSQLK